MSEELNLAHFWRVHDLLLSVVEDALGGTLPVPGAVDAFRARGCEDGPEAKRWLELLDAAVGPHQLRCAVEQFKPGDAELSSLLRYFATKAQPRPADCERMEWLATYLVRRISAEPSPAPSEILSLLHDRLPAKLSPHSREIEQKLAELGEIQVQINVCGSFLELIQSGLMICGRRVKRSCQDNFACPEVLASVVNYNLVAGTRFQQLLSGVIQAPSGLSPEITTLEYGLAAEEFQQWSRKAAGPRPAPKDSTAGTTGQRGAATPPNGKCESATSKNGALRSDPLVDDARFSGMISKLCTYARAAGEAPSTIPLPNSSLSLSPLEAQSLVVEYPVTEKSFRADLIRILRRAVGLIAVIQEDYELYRVRSTSEYLWRKHLDSLLYFAGLGRDVLPELEALAQEAGRRGLQSKTEQLTNTVTKLQQQLNDIALLGDPGAASEQSLATRACA